VLEQMSSHLGNICSMPKQLCSLHQEYPKLSQQRKLSQLQLCAVPVKIQFRTVFLTSNMILQCSQIPPTSLLPASPKYTGRSSARPTATRSLKKHKHIKKAVLNMQALVAKVKQTPTT
jgi:hypothetical protein